MSATKGSPLPRTEMDALLLGRLDELTVNEPSSRGRSLLGIVLSIVVLIAISTFIVAAITLINPDIGAQLGARRTPPREAISLEEIFSGALAPAGFAPIWLPATATSSGETTSGPDSSPDELLFEESRDLHLVTLGGGGGDQEPPGEGELQTTQPEVNTTSTTRRRFGPGARVETLVASGSLLSSVDYQEAQLSPSRRFLLLRAARLQQFRHSFTAKYFLYDTQEDLITLLSTEPQGQQQQQTGGSTGAGESPDSTNLNDNGWYGAGATTRVFMGHELEDPRERHVRFQLAKWFVDAAGHDSLLLAQHNDLYVLPNVAQLPPGGPTRLTRTGIPGVVYNGLPDWLHEEEIMMTGAPAHEISPGGGASQHLAYLAYNDSRVTEQPITWFTGERYLAPRVQQLRYPLAGTPNPEVSLHVIENFASQPADARDFVVELPPELAKRQHYLYRIRWLTHDKLGLIWSNRAQNESQVLICSSSRPGEGGSWNCTRSLTTVAPDGWLDIADDLEPLDERHYLTLVPKFEGPDVGTFRHVARVPLGRPDALEFLTSGRREVAAINGLDRARQLLYYTATPEGEPGQQHLFVTSLEPSKTSEDAPRAPDTCLTCALGRGCLHTTSRLSPSARHLVLTCNGPDVPRTELRAIEHEGEGGPAREADSELAAPARVTTRRLSIIEDNRALRDKLERVKAMPVSVRLRVPIAGTPYQASVHLLLPPLLGPATSFQKGPGAGGGASGGPAAIPGLPDLSNLFAWAAASNSDSDPDSKNSENSKSGRSRRAQTPNDHHHHQDHAQTTTDEGAEQIRQYIKQMHGGGGGGNNNQQGGLPMVVDVYGGPSQQRVDYELALTVGHYFASSRRMVYAMIDGRGSGREGSRRAFEMFGQFGKVEVEDQIQVTRDLVRGLLAPLVDPAKVAIWGWSYGGFAAAMALARSNMPLAYHHNRHSFSKNSTTTSPNVGMAPTRGVFECAASVAPTTNLIYYDTAYSERYLRSPWKNERYDLHRVGDHLDHEDFAAPTNLTFDDNQATVPTPTPTRRPNMDVPNGGVAGQLAEDLNERYKRSNLLEYIGNIDRKRFLLMHGTADDNVHLQSTLRLMREMIKRGILFETRLYPDQRHSMSDMASQLHLHNTLSNFFAECFDMAY